MRGAWAGEGGAASRRAARAGTAAALFVFLLLATAGRPWLVFDRGPFTSDFYDAQARALSRGHLDVPPEVAGIEGFVVDGRTHLYYGLVPALARLPIAAVTTKPAGRLVVVSQLAGLAVGCLAAARLLRRGRITLGAAVPRRWEPWLCGGFALATGLATPALFLSSRSIVYHEAELWGAALALLGFERVIAWWASRTWGDLVLASAVAALAVSTRGSSGTGPAVALGLLAVVLAARRDWPRSAGAVAAAVVPVALYAAVNMARFGTLFSVPFEAQVLNEFSAQRRAALAANDGSLFGLQFLPTALLQYVRPDTIQPRALLPFLAWGARARVVGDATFDTIDRAASLPVTAPLFLAAAIPGAWAMVRRRVPVAWAACLTAAALATLPTLTIAFVAHRYLADFVPGLVLAAALGVPVVAAWVATRSPGWRRGAVLGATALLLVGIGVNGSLAVLARHLYLVPDEDETLAFVSAQYRLHDLVPGGRPPYVSAAAALPPVGADGDVVIVGDCAGLYRSDGETWRALEHRAGAGQRVVLSGEPADGTVPVASGRGWLVELTAAGPSARLTYRGPGGVVVEGTPIARTDARLVLDLVADPALPTVTVDVDGREVLGAFLQPATGPVAVAPGWSQLPGAAPLCARLLDGLTP